MRSLSYLVLFSVLLFGYITPLLAACSGSPPTYNGLPCATTTRYWDDQEGACGCGDSSGPFSWSLSTYTAAGSDALFGAGSTWCGSGCGTCYELTPTGDCTTSAAGTCATTTSPIVVMVTNLCPYNGNQEWCPQSGSTNTYGYGAHFDLMDYNMDGLITALGWNNPVVTYKQVACGSSGSPTCTDAAECVCTNTGTGCTGSTASASASTNTTKSSTTSATSTTAPTVAATTSSSTSTTNQGSTSTTGSSANEGSSTTSCSSSSITLTQSNVGSWQSGSSTVNQYNVEIASTCSGKTLTALTLSATEWSSVFNSWNVAASLSGTSATLTLPSWLSITTSSPLSIGYQTTSSQVTFTVLSYTFA